ncbi:MAG: hypothetical protein WCV73_04910 [Patescibacteria group bacterium]|jgi:hypothetical protein
MSSTTPRAFLDFLESHRQLLSQRDEQWQRTLRAIVRRSTSEEGLRLQLVELVDAGKQPKIHLSIRAKALCLLMTPSLAWFDGSLVRSELINAHRPLTPWLADIANINWTFIPYELMSLAKELILISWKLIPDRDDTVSREKYSRHLLEYASVTLDEELVQMYPLDCLPVSYAAVIKNRQIPTIKRLTIDASIRIRIEKGTPDEIKSYFWVIMETCKLLLSSYPSDLLVQQLLFIAPRHKDLLAPLLNIKMMGMLMHIATATPEMDDALVHLITNFVSSHTEGSGNCLTYTGPADMETLILMKRRMARAEYARVARTIGDTINKLETKIASCTCSTGACPCQGVEHPAVLAMPKMQ